MPVYGTDHCAECARLAEVLAQHRASGHDEVDRRVVAGAQRLMHTPDPADGLGLDEMDMGIARVVGCARAVVSAIDELPDPDPMEDQ